METKLPRLENGINYYYSYMLLQNLLFEILLCQRKFLAAKNELISSVIVNFKNNVNYAPWFIPAIMSANRKLFEHVFLKCWTQCEIYTGDFKEYLTRNWYTAYCVDDGKLFNNTSCNLVIFRRRAERFAAKRTEVLLLLSHCQHNNYLTNVLISIFCLKTHPSWT